MDMDTVRIPQRIHIFLTEQGAYEQPGQDQITVSQVSNVAVLTGTREQLASLGLCLAHLADEVESQKIKVGQAGGYNHHLLRGIGMRFPADPNPPAQQENGPVYTARLRPERIYTQDGSATVTITETTTGTDKGTYRIPTRSGSLYDAASSLLALGWKVTGLPSVDREGRATVRVAPADLLTGTPEQDNATAVKAVMALSEEWEPARIPRDIARDWGNVPGLRGFVVEPVQPGVVFVVQAKQAGDDDHLKGYAATLARAGWSIASMTALRIEARSPGN